MFKVTLAVVLFAAAGALAQVSCDRYCELMFDANCTGNTGTIRGQYASFAECVTVCQKALWVNGTDADTSVNTLGCRIYHANVANITADPVAAAPHCGHAGFTGAGVCGTYFENYCHYQNGCGFKVPADGCAATAALYPTGTPLEYVVAAAGSGNTHACRFYHMFVAYSSASVSDFGVHCGHGALASKENICGTTIEGYCTAVVGTATTAVCTGAQSGFSGVLSNCTQVTTSQGVLSGELTDTSADSLQCRTYHAVVANSVSVSNGKAVHCPHAGPSGGGACAAACDDYCRLYQLACPASINSTQYASTAACRTACAAFPPGVFSDIGGDTAFCRIYHVNVASLSPALAQVHCFHAQQVPTDFCVNPAPATTGSDDNKSAASFATASVVLAAGSVFAAVF